jgi:hypothetical protein
VYLFERYTMVDIVLVRGLFRVSRLLPADTTIIIRRRLGVETEFM